MLKRIGIWMLVLLTALSTALAERETELTLTQAVEIARARMAAVCGLTEEEAAMWQTNGAAYSLVVKEDGGEIPAWSVNFWYADRTKMLLEYGTTVLIPSGEIFSETGAADYAWMMCSLEYDTALAQWEADKGPRWFWSLEDQYAFAQLYQVGSGALLPQPGDISLEEAERIAREAIKSAYGDAVGMESTRKVAFDLTDTGEYRRLAVVFRDMNDNYSFLWQVDIDPATGKVLEIWDVNSGNG